MLLEGRIETTKLTEIFWVMVEARLENWRLVDMKTQASKRFDKKLFEKAVIDSFHFLQDRYGFSAPVANDYGREIFVKYERGNQTVSVSYMKYQHPQSSCHRLGHNGRGDCGAFGEHRRACDFARYCCERLAR
jgi:hypothetical protein